MAEELTEVVIRHANTGKGNLLLVEGANYVSLMKTHVATSSWNGDALQQERGVPIGAFIAILVEKGDLVSISVDGSSKGIFKYEENHLTSVLKVDELKVSLEKLEG